MNMNAEPEQYAVVTDVGKRKLDALMLGETLRLTELAFGDGNGSSVTPDIGSVALAREIGRETITVGEGTYYSAGVEMTSEIINKYQGMWLREVGLFDEDGDLIVWGSVAPTLVSMFSERSVIVHLPVENQDQIAIVVDTTKRYVTVAEFEAFKDSIQSLLSPMDYSEHATQLADTRNPIYETLPASVMAVIPAGLLQGFNDEEGSAIFVPFAGIEYVLSITTARNSIGFDQVITFIERTDDKQERNQTFKRSGRSFADATVWASMTGVLPNQELTVKRLFFRENASMIGYY
ncbi:phage tail protein [Vibrio sp. OPT18]|nr:phage tail protein [Vibrio sp. OPT18]